MAETGSLLLAIDKSTLVIAGSPSLFSAAGRKKVDTGKRSCGATILAPTKSELSSSLWAVAIAYGNRCRVMAGSSSLFSAAGRKKVGAGKRIRSHTASGEASACM